MRRKITKGRKRTTRKREEIRVDLITNQTASDSKTCPQSSTWKFFRVMGELVVLTLKVRSDTVHCMPLPTFNSHIFLLFSIVVIRSSLTDWTQETASFSNWKVSRLFRQSDDSSDFLQHKMSYWGCIYVHRCIGPETDHRVVSRK